MKTLALTLLLLALLLGSALAQVYFTHQQRRLFATIEALKAEQWRLQQTWEQQLLRQSELAALPRIEAQASRRLGMIVPDLKQNNLKYIETVASPTRAARGPYEPGQNHGR